MSVVTLLHALTVPAMLHVGGTAIPLKNVTGAFDDVATSIVKKETLPQALTRIAPDMLPIILTASNVAIPYSGLAVVVILVALKYSKPPNAVEQQRMWDIAQGVH